MNYLKALFISMLIMPTVLLAQNSSDYVKSDIDKIVYSVEDDPEAKTKSMLDMLRKVPMVTIDGQDNIMVNGSSSFKVYVNERPNNMMGRNPQEIFRSMKTNSVKAIEVITNPGAQYDAEGMTTILNIVTKEERVSESTATIGGLINNTTIGGNAYASIQNGKFSFTGTYNYQHINAPDTRYDSGRTDYTSDDYYELETLGNSQQNSDSHSMNLEGSYQISSRDQLSLSTNVYKNNTPWPNETNTQMRDKQGNVVYSYHSNQEFDTKQDTVGVKLEYRHNFRKPGEQVSLSYNLSYTKSDNYSEIDYSNVIGLEGGLTDTGFSNISHITRHLVQLDYRNPLSPMHSISLGGKYIGNKNSNNSKMFMADDNSQMQVVDGSMSKYSQTRNILAGYADYQLTWGSLVMRAGMRYEHTFMNVDYALNPERNFDTGFDDLVPTFNLSYQGKGGHSLRFNYNLRITRPNITSLNPFRNTSSPVTVTYGNPDLETEKTHYLELNYSLIKPKFSVNMTLIHQFNNNSIESYSFIQNNIMNTTYGNVGQIKHTILNTWVTWTPSDKTSVSANITETYSDLKSKALNSRNSGFSTSASITFQQSLPWGLRLSANAMAYTRTIMLQGYMGGNHSYGLNLTRSFFKNNRLTVSIYATNLFKKYNSFRNETITEDFYSWNRTDSIGRTYGLNATLRL